MIVLDTNVLSYIFGGDRRAGFYIDQLKGERAIISFQSVEEMWFGAYLRSWGDRRRQELASFLEQYEIIFPNVHLTDICARLRAERQSSGKKLTLADSWIAATAFLLDCSLATHDGDFEGIPNIKIIRAP